MGTLAFRGFAILIGIAFVIFGVLWAVNGWQTSRAAAEAAAPAVETAVAVSDQAVDTVSSAAAAGFEAGAEAVAGSCPEGWTPDWSDPSQKKCVPPPSVRSDTHHECHSPNCDPASKARVENLQARWNARGAENTEPQKLDDMRCAEVQWDGTAIRWGIFVAQKFTTQQIKGDASFFDLSGWYTSYPESRWLKDFLQPSHDLVEQAAKAGATLVTVQVPCTQLPASLPAWDAVPGGQ
jgi:hypothetical protein